MIIHCTQKLLTELKIDPTNVETESGFLGSWHANMFRIERRKCVLITNDETLYTLFIPALRKPEFKVFDLVFKQQFFKNLLYEEIPQNLLEVALLECEEIQYAKTNNRSVLGSMNDQKFQLEFHIYDAGGLDFIDVFDLNRKLNQNILSAINYNHPIDVLKERLQKLCR